MAGLEQGQQGHRPMCAVLVAGADVPFLRESNLYPDKNTLDFFRRPRQRLAS